MSLFNFLKDEIDNIHTTVVQELTSSFESNESKKKKKKKKKKSKKTRKSKLKKKKSKRQELCSDESTQSDESDSFDDEFDEAVRDTNLDTIASRQLEQLAEIQEELLDLQKPSDDNMTGSDVEEDPLKDDRIADDEPFLPPSNQQATYHNDTEVYLYY